MNIVFVIRRLPPHGGGAEIQALRLADALSRRGHSVRVLGGKLPETYRDNPHLQLLPDSYLRIWGTLKFHFSLWWTLRKEGKNIDAVQTYFPNETSLLLSKWCVSNHVPLFYKLSGDGEIGDIACSNSRFIHKICWDSVRRSANTIIAVSSALSERLNSELAGFSARGTIIPNGIDIRQFHPSSDTVGKNKNRLLFVGRLRQEKNLASLMDAIKVSSFCLDIVGDGPERALLEARVIALGLSERIRFLGYKRDVAGIYSAYASLIVPSFSEGLSNVMLESMASGVPVISTPVSGSRDAIDDGQNGILANGFSKEDLFEALSRFANLPDEDIVHMGRLARESVEKKFSIEAVADAYERLYKGAC
ncbi:MAG: hypothetical protein A2X49_14310 [Lentisphaerae bacterium GWF2_52_8]|nr:MAG: hypothetical protein A2X49_14310 [Lentisphaerae bacterium GWF2_52_8]